LRLQKTTSGGWESDDEEDPSLLVAQLQSVRKSVAVSQV
jgi:hypothetical protein